MSEQKTYTILEAWQAKVDDPDLVIKNTNGCEAVIKGETLLYALSGTPIAISAINATGWTIERPEPKCEDGYRWLELGEVIQEGDELKWGRWFKACETIGKKVTCCHYVRRKVEPEYEEVRHEVKWGQGTGFADDLELTYWLSRKDLIGFEYEEMPGERVGFPVLYRHKGTRRIGENMHSTVAERIYPIAVWAREER